MIAQVKFKRIPLKDDFAEEAVIPHEIGRGAAVFPSGAIKSCLFLATSSAGFVSCSSFFLSCFTALLRPLLVSPINLFHSWQLLLPAPWVDGFSQRSNSVYSNLLKHR